MAEQNIRLLVQKLQTVFEETTIFTVPPHYERWENGFKSLDEARKKISALKVELEAADNGPAWISGDLARIHGRLNDFVRLRDDFYKQFPNGGDSHEWHSKDSAERNLSELQHDVARLKHDIRSYLASSRQSTKSDLGRPKDSALRFLSPDSLIQAAVKANPAFKYAIAVGGLAGLVAVVSRYGVSVVTLVFGSIIIVVLMVLFLVFSQAAIVARKHFSLSGAVLIWSFITISILTAFFLFSSSFFNRPLPFRDYIVRQLNPTPTPTPTPVPTSTPTPTPVPTSTPTPTPVLTPTPTPTPPIYSYVVTIEITVSRGKVGAHFSRYNGVRLVGGSKIEKLWNIDDDSPKKKRITPGFPVRDRVEFDDPGIYIFDLSDWDDSPMIDVTLTINNVIYFKGSGNSSHIKDWHPHLGPNTSIKDDREISINLK